MFSAVRAQGFRCFEDITVQGLGRVNLFVGRNNAGKTTLLEGIELLAKGPNPEAVMDLLDRRWEWGHRPGLGDRRWLDAAGLFRGRAPELGSAFTLSAWTDEGATTEHEPPARALRCEVALPRDLPEGDATVGSQREVVRDAMKRGVTMLATSVLRLTMGDLWSAVPLHGRYARPEESELSAAFGMGSTGALPVQLVTPSTIYDEANLTDLWDAVSLTQGEEAALRALRVVEPRIERLAFLGMAEGWRLPFVTLQGVPDRVPLGNLGEGVTRMLVLALAMGQLVPWGSDANPLARVLLVDEIDAGLHHAVLEDVWRMVMQAARDYGLQVFATTHSYDCLHALAEVVLATPTLPGEVTVHRVHAGKRVTTRFDGEELEVVRAGHLEVR